ncbi:hypothetical protein BHE74_00003111 [Ensete ventricosum]|nr:hypothetical protein GW17_00042185 [Ensete ventricosum]RWW88024.1 hypothetical protein BHE74_00003111 [Ensete ventricosum]RZR75913.1 hypothetical protein BHM03_00000498 [Ensete ventricosum]
MIPCFVADLFSLTCLYMLEKSSVPVAEQCAWALGNVAGEGDELRNILLAQGALLPLARLMMSTKGSTARTASWALSNLIKVMRGMPNGEGPKLVEREDGIDAMERFQFHENEEMRIMANGLVDKYFGEDYGLNE